MRLSRDLGWDEKEKVHVIIKHMFDPADGRSDVFFYDNLKQEIEPELNKMGTVESVKIFERNPEGVVAVKYAAGWGAERCIEERIIPLQPFFFQNRDLQLSR